MFMESYQKIVKNFFEAITPKKKIEVLPQASQEEVVTKSEEQ